MGGPRFRLSPGTDHPPRRVFDEGAEILRQRRRPGNGPMIHSPIALAIVLGGLVVGLLSLEKVPAFKKIFHYLPSAFWCYFLPMLLSTFGLLPNESPVYDFLTTYVLSACLILLLVD